jgi:hypothetical protein
MASPALVVCGPQSSFPTDEYLNSIQQNLLHNPSLEKFVSAIKDLPRVWQKLVELDPRLSKIPGLESVAAIYQWIQQGEFPPSSNKSLNVLLAPLTVVFQIAEYINFLDSNKEGITHPLVLQTALTGGFQGFCTGILAAAALSSAKDVDDINSLGAVTLRIAVCVGAFADLAGLFAEPSNEVSCVTARWRNDDGKKHVAEVLKEYSSVSTGSLRCCGCSPPAHTSL